MKIKIRVKGTTPLIMDKMDCRSKDLCGDTRIEKDGVEARIHRNPQGRIAIPADQLLIALIEAGTMVNKDR